MIRTSKRLTTTLIAVGATAMFGAACGDDDGGSPDARVTIDGSTIDSSVPADAAGPTRSATIAITEVDLTTPTDPPRGIGGAAISISASDLTTGGGDWVFGSPTDQIPCSVFHFEVGKDAAKLPNPAVSMGTVTISNTDAKNPAILGSSPAACNFVEALDRYLCPVKGGAAQAGAYAVPQDNAVAYTFTAQTFDANIVGAYLNVSGIEAAGFNGTFPIVQRPAANTIVIANEAVDTPAAPVAFAAATFQILQGVGPIPGGAALDFLSDGTPATEQVHVVVPASAELGFPGGVDVNIVPAGDGLVLNTECEGCIAPHQMPTSIAKDDTETTVSFSCDISDNPSSGPNTCGTIPATGIVGWAISGSTTDADVEGVREFDMPAPVERWSTFTCTGFGNTITLSNAMLKAILVEGTTRIETRALRINAARPPQVNIVVGHGFVGHTDVPQPKSN